MEVMYKIRYYYASLAKQFFMGMILLWIFLRLAIFFASGYYRQSYLLATIAVYLLVIGLCLFFMTAWKYFYTEFTETTITWHNLLMKKEKSLSLEQVQFAHFTKRGIKLYCAEDERPLLFIPFYCFGIVSPVGVENFMNLMKNRRVRVELDYEVLPGFGIFSKWYARGYILLSVLIFINSFQYIFLLILILRS